MVSTTQGPDRDGTKGDAAKEVVGDSAEQVRQVTQVATDRGKELASTAADEARHVGQEAFEQARSVLEDAKQQAHQQAQAQTERAGEAMSRLRDQAQALLEGHREDAGPLAGYAQQGVDKLGQLTGRVQTGGFDGVVSDLQRFARRRPGAFLLGAGAVGFGVGRLLRANRDQGNGDSANSSLPSVSQPVLPVTPEPQLPVGVAAGVPPTHGVGDVGMVR